MDRCGHALTSKQQIADMARSGLAQTREQRLALLDGLTTGKQAPSANALEVVARASSSQDRRRRASAEVWGMSGISR